MLAVVDEHAILGGRRLNMYSSAFPDDLEMEIVIRRMLGKRILFFVNTLLKVT